MSEVIDIPQPKRPRHRGARQARESTNRPNGTMRRWPLVAGVLGVELLFVLGLVVAVPMGRGAVALTFALAFLLAICVGACLEPEERNGAHH